MISRLFLLAYFIIMILFVFFIFAGRPAEASDLECRKKLSTCRIKLRRARKKLKACLGKPEPTPEPTPAETPTGLNCQPRAFSTGVLWKPESDVSDSRGGKPAVLFQGSKKPGTDSVSVFAQNGQEVCKLTFKAPTEEGVNGNSDHYFSGWFGGCGLTGEEIREKAKQVSDRFKVLLEGAGGVCYGPFDARDRQGGIG